MFAIRRPWHVHVDLEVPITGNFQLVGNLTVSFSDEYAVQGALELTLIQDS